MQGLVVNKQKASFVVLVNGEVRVCKPSGNLIKSNDIVYVGDYVRVAENDNLITELLERKNFLIRPSVANVDIVVIVMSLVEPLYSSLLVEKFLSYVNFAEASPVVVITKLDKDPGNANFSVLTENLRKLNVQYFVVNNKTGEGISEVKELLRSKVVALMGQSGVGKSSFINALTNHKREIGQYSININRGRHVTKEVIMLPFNEGYIIDTPGFSSFELPLTKGDLAENFPSFKAYLGQCKFNDCTHINEPGCALKKALNNGELSEESYRNYVIINSELKMYREDYK